MGHGDNEGAEDDGLYFGLGDCLQGSVCISDREIRRRRVCVCVFVLFVKISTYCVCSANGVPS